MSLDINRVIMEATSSLVETTQNAGDKAQSGDHDVHVPADKNSVHVPADKVVGAVAKAPVKPVTEGEVGKVLAETDPIYTQLASEAGKKMQSDYDMDELKRKALKYGGPAAAAIAAGLGAVALAKKLRQKKRAAAKA